MNECFIRETDHFDQRKGVNIFLEASHEEVIGNGGHVRLRSEIILYHNDRADG